MASRIPKELTKLAVPIDDVQPHPSNARIGDVDTIIDSLRTNGQYRPIVVNKRNGYIVAGNHTWQAAKALKWGKIAATYVDADDDLERRILLVDNAANDRAGYDDEKLLELLKPFGYDLAGTGFDTDALLAIHERQHAASTKKPKADPDTIPDPPKTRPKSKKGTIWHLGEHRLLVGDALDEHGLDALMDGDTAHALITDPPYNVDVQGAAGKIKNDSMPQEQFATFIEGALRNATRHLMKGGPFYIFAPDGDPNTDFRNAIRATPELELKQGLVWAKHAHTLGRQDYQWQHEAVLYGWRLGASHKWYGGRNKVTMLEDDPTLLSITPTDEGFRLRIGNGSRTIILDVPSYDLKAADLDLSTVWRFDKPGRNPEHPTMKPVEMVQRALRNSTRHRDVVLDVFGGSGTTLIACEMEQRQARLVELDPKYADVICRRFQLVTGIVPVKADHGPVSFLTKAEEKEQADGDAG